MKRGKRTGSALFRRPRKRSSGHSHDVWRVLLASPRRSLQVLGRLVAQPLAMMGQGIGIRSIICVGINGMKANRCIQVCECDGIAFASTHVLANWFIRDASH